MKSGNTKTVVALLGLASLLHFEVASAQIVVEEGTPAPAPRTAPPPAQVGEGAASDYFKKRSTKSSSASTMKESARIMGVHLGTFLNDTAYRWGRRNKTEDAGKGMLGVTYRVGEWTSSMDLNIRAEIMTYDIDNTDPLKLSVMPIVQFPDARSDFPLYFGVGAGAGIFFDQAGDESDLSFDYALIVGARFPQVFERAGLFFETGLKGQVHLLSSGQHDGVFLAAGALFAF